MSNMVLDAALAYAELGYPVFPCAPDAKIPITSNGFKDATTNIEQIESWWESHPNANIGLPASGLIVVDVDGPDNKWPKDQEKAESLTAGPVSKTPRGGRHYIFRQPEGKTWKNSANKLAPKVDTRASGGYIVVPPSKINDKGYEWIDSMELDVSVTELPTPPQWLIDELDSIGNPSQPIKIDSGSSIASGQRNDTLTRLAGSMRRVGMCQPEILVAMTQVNQDRCDPPLSENDVLKITNSICRYAPDEVATSLVEGNYAYFGPPEPVPNFDDPGNIPSSLLRIPGLISEIMDYGLETAPYPNVVMAFCGALALQAVLSGRKVRDPGDNRTNFYLLGLAHSAAGKDWPRKINTTVLYNVGLSEHLGERFASGEGIQDALFLTPSMLFQTDEIDGMLQSINKSKDARHENIMSTLLTMYSSASSVFPMRRKASKEAAGSIDQPCLTIFGTAIPNHYYEALSERMLTNGFFARMIILESDKRGAGQEPQRINIPDRVLATAKWWAAFRPGPGNLEALHPSPITVQQTAGAKKILIDTRKEAEAEYAKAEDKGDSVGTTVWGRVSEQSRKLALIYAISSNHNKPEINSGAAKWATEFIMHQTKRMLFMAQAHVADNPFHADCLKIVKKLTEAKDGMLSHSVLLKRMKMDSQSFQKIIGTMAQRGDITSQVQSTTGRKGLFYKLVNGGE